MVNVEVLVIGAGTAGIDAASFARKNTDSVALVEKGVAGGDCTYNACMPTKALVQAARLYKSMKSADFFGLPILESVADYSRVRAFKDRIVSQIGAGQERKLARSGLKLFQGNARFVSPHEVTVGDELIKAEKIIIATGSVPGVPPIPGLNEAGYVTNVEALKLDSAPTRLAIIGGGAVGVEFAQIFAAFGSKVHIYEAGGRILAGEDEDISVALTDSFAGQGISVTTSTGIERIGTTRNGKLVTTRDASGVGRSEEFDEILVATGRKPAIDGLNLEAAGVRFNNKGIIVDSSTRTNVPHIWAAGDVTGTALFTLVAWEQGEVAGSNATSQERKELNYEILPRVTFCDPEVASVGLTEQQARAQQYRVKAGKFDYSHLSRTIVTNETEGFIKIVAEQSSGRILGGHIIGFEASILIHEIAAAMAKGLTVSDIGNTFHAFPTYSEGVRYACQSLMA
ncbi:MAG: NAD(P)/FAD-dependent oxidoreductase [Chloroflexi bacterium]|nr:NAD(P)/FAD-dependent oxidoreductase [Chloroflexota bacterium]